MGKYLVRGNYTGDGVAGLAKEGGTAREAAARASVESVGGTIDAMYYAFGETDVYGIADFPNDAAATAWSLLINASGGVEVNLIPLMTPAEVDAAAELSPSFRPPGD